MRNLHPMQDPNLFLSLGNMKHTMVNCGPWMVMAFQRTDFEELFLLCCQERTVKDAIGSAEMFRATCIQSDNREFGIVASSETPQPLTDVPEQSDSESVFGCPGQGKFKQVAGARAWCTHAKGNRAGVETQHQVAGHLSPLSVFLCVCLDF